MEQNQPPHIIQAALVADSRGKYMDTIFNNLNDYPVQFSVHRRNGAQLAELWEIAESIILFDHPDIIYIFGGVCDLTEALYLPNGVREFWPVENFGRGHGRGHGRWSQIPSESNDATESFARYEDTMVLRHNPRKEIEKDGPSIRQIT